jgi:hypothetical protein
VVRVVRSCSRKSSDHADERMFKGVDSQAGSRGPWLSTCRMDRRQTPWPAIGPPDPRRGYIETSDTALTLVATILMKDIVVFAPLDRFLQLRVIARGTVVV